MLFPSRPNTEPAPEPDYEGCSNDHADFWKPDTTDGVSIVVDSGPADQDCNELFFHNGGGGQAGDIFHIEPVLRVAGDGQDLTDVTWDVYDIDDPGNVLFSQGFEIYEEDLRVVDGAVEHRARVFIGLEDRGKNVRLVATTYLPTDGGTDVLIQPEAAVYISGPAP